MIQHITFVSKIFVRFSFLRRVFTGLINNQQLWKMFVHTWAATCLKLKDLKWNTETELALRWAWHSAVIFHLERGRETKKQKTQIKWQLISYSVMKYCSSCCHFFLEWPTEGPEIVRIDYYRGIWIDHENSNPVVAPKSPLNLEFSFCLKFSWMFLFLYVCIVFTVTQQCSCSPLEKSDFNLKESFTWLNKQYAFITLLSFKLLWQTFSTQV